jgi:type II secretory pathway pseudopilin PulG
MTGTEAKARSAWANRIRAVLLLPFAFVVMVGGGAGIIWLWRDYRAQLWVGLCAITIVGLLASSAARTLSRSRRRTRWEDERTGAARAEADQAEVVLEENFRTRAERRRAAALVDPLSTADPTELMAEVLAGIEAMQQHLSVLVSQVATEQKVSSGRHASPVMVDIRDEVTDLSDLDDDLLDDDLLDDDIDYTPPAFADDTFAGPSYEPISVEPPSYEQPLMHALPEPVLPEPVMPEPVLPEPEPVAEAVSLDADDLDADDQDDEDDDSTQLMERPDYGTPPVNLAAVRQAYASTAPELHDAADLTTDAMAPQLTRQPWEIPDQREHVQVIQLPRDGAAGEEFEDEDDDYYGENGFDATPGEGQLATERNASQPVEDHFSSEQFSRDQVGGDQFTGERERRPRDAR